MAETDTKQQAERDEALKKAYQSATKRLREESRDRFNVLYAEEAKKRGVEWKPKPTKEQRAEEEMARLIAEFPHLAEKFAEPEGVAEPEPEDEPVKA